MTVQTVSLKYMIRKIETFHRTEIVLYIVIVMRGAEHLHISFIDMQSRLCSFHACYFKSKKAEKSPPMRLLYHIGGDFYDG